MKSLYIHVPFCRKKCFYCSFVVLISKKNKINEYVNALNDEARLHDNAFIDSIYIGGGTPTFLSNIQLKNLLNIIKNNFRFSKSCEFTVEANPEDVDLDKLKLLRDSGVNRISLGVQTLNNKYLTYLGRCHNRSQAVKTYENIREIGFENINLDLMYSFPKQTDQEIEEDIDAISSLGSEHLSLYALTIEPDSKFYTKKLALDDAGHRSAQYVLVCELLDKNGFNQYEVSNFSKPGFESKHNINYWVGGNYIGLGVGSHSHIDGRRYWNVSKMNEYLSRIKNNQNAAEGQEILKDDERLTEALLFGIRMNRGVAIKDIQRKFKCRLPDNKKEIINNLVSEGFLFEEKGFLKATKRGRVVLDEICVKLI